MEEPVTFPPNAFLKMDEEDDAVFYLPPRFVTHIDDPAIAALGEFYCKTLPAGGVLLDLMSSWVSHLPETVSYREVIGLGMNEAELAKNPRLTRHFVQDLNKTPTLPLADSSVDAAMICVSIQYLQQPVAVLADVARVLVPGGPLIVSFSNRCFPTKAVAIWRALGDADHANLVGIYMRQAGFASIAAHVLKDGSDSDPLIAVVGRTSSSS